MTRVLSALVVLATVAVAPALAQSPPPSSAPGIELRLTRPWFGPSVPLSLEVLLTSRGVALEALRATVSLYDRVETRSQLRQLFDGRPRSTPVEAFTEPLDDLPAERLLSARFERPLSGLRAFQDAPHGVYPLSVTVSRRSGPVLARATTAVTFAGEEAETPLLVLPVGTVVPEPVLGPDGLPTARTEATLADLRRGLSALAGSSAPGAVAVDPLLLDELRQLHNTPLRARAADVEAALRTLAASSPVLRSPATNIQTSHVPSLLGPDALRSELDAGVATLRRLGAEPAEVLLPPGLSLDDRSLTALASSGVQGVIVDGAVVPPVTRGRTSADPVVHRGVTVLPADERIGSSIRTARSDAEASRIVADLAMAHFESPARRRLVAFTADVRNARLPGLLAAMRDLPVVRVVSPAEAVAGPWRARTLRLPASSRPARTFERSLEDARRAVEAITAYTLEGNPAVARLRLSLRAGTATAWWSDEWTRGVSWNRGVVRGASREKALVTTVSDATVTFTSRRGRIPVTIVNRAEYPVRVRVEIESTRLRFPRGASRTIRSLTRPGEVVTFDALTEATGTFPLTIRVTSPDGAVLVDERELLVRSTALNGVALALTIGAGVFLIAWSSRRLVTRRRRSAPAVERPRETTVARPG